MRRGGKTNVVSSSTDKFNRWPICLSVVCRFTSDEFYRNNSHPVLARPVLSGAHRDTIDNMRLTDESPMAGGLLDTLTKEQIRDLVAYLMQPAQVALAEEATQP